MIAKAPGSYEYFIARTAFFDAAVRRALDENVPQIVLLGAGYDSRAYRFADRIRDTRIFELDVPSLRVPICKGGLSGCQTGSFGSG